MYILRSQFPIAFTKFLPKMVRVNFRYFQHCCGVWVLNNSVNQFTKKCQCNKVSCWKPADRQSDIEFPKNFARKENRTSKRIITINLTKIWHKIKRFDFTKVLSQFKFIKVILRKKFSPACMPMENSPIHGWKFFDYSLLNNQRPKSCWNKSEAPL